MPLRRRLKNIVVMLLVALSVYQTVKLWFGDISIRNFFYAFPDFFIQYNLSESLSSLVRPYRIITSHSHNVFSILYSDIDGSPQKDAGEKAIGQTLLKGDYVGSYQLDLWDLLSRRGMIYNYRFPMPAETFVKYFKQKTSFLTGKVKSFDSIYIFPGKNDSEGVTVVFADSREGNAYEYGLRNYEIADLNNIINQETARDLYYTSSVLNSYHIGEKENFFIAEWEDNNPEYYNMQPSFPIKDLLFTEIEQFVKPFFRSSSINTNSPGGVYTYSDEYTVVRYYPTNVLEYRNYRYVDVGLAVNLENAYSAAMGIIERDSMVNNQFSLSGYTYQNNRYHFYFDCIVNNFPVFLTKNARTVLEIENLIEVEVEDNNVIYYKRYVCDFLPDNSRVQRLSGSGFVKDMENVFGQEPEGSQISLERDINQLDFGYIVNLRDILYLGWYLESDGKEFTQLANE